MMSELKPCDKDVFERGTVLCIFEGTSEEAEEFCKERTKHTGHKHDWHTFAGRKVVKYLATEPDTIQVSRAEYEALRNELELTKDNLRHMTESRDAVARKLTDAINACVRAAEETGDDNIKSNGVSDPYNDGYFAGAYDVQQKLTVIRDAAINKPANGEGRE